MITLEPATTAGTIDPTSFGLLTWGSILLVAIVFGYIAWMVLLDSQRT